MPTSPPRWCPRCKQGHTTPCPVAQAERQRQYDERRGTAKQRGYGVAHRRWREAILRRDPFCMDCLDGKRVVAATEAHHIEALRKGGQPFDLDNGMGLCRACHSVRTARGE